MQPKCSPHVIAPEVLIHDVKVRVDMDAHAHLVDIPLNAAAHWLEVGGQNDDIDAILSSLRQDEVNAPKARLIPHAWRALDGIIAKIVSVLEAEHPHKADGVLGHHLQHTRNACSERLQLVMYASVQHAGRVNMVPWFLPIGGTLSTVIIAHSPCLKEVLVQEVDVHHTCNSKSCLTPILKNERHSKLTEKNVRIWSSVNISLMGRYL